jgi:uncharacterized protein GlcG (DUF336 family)
MNFPLEMAEAVVAAAIAATSAKGFPAVNISIVDVAAHPVLFARMDGALLGAIDVATRKARTAALFQTDSAVLGKVAQPGATSYSLEYTNGGLISFGGGVVLRDRNGDVLGAVGISGASVEQDEIIAHAAALVALNA